MHIPIPIPVPVTKNQLLPLSYSFPVKVIISYQTWKRNDTHEYEFIAISNFMFPLYLCEVVHFILPPILFLIKFNIIVQKKYFKYFMKKHLYSITVIKNTFYYVT